jgi:hypothetical protein
MHAAAKLAINDPVRANMASIIRPFGMADKPFLRGCAAVAVSRNAAVDSAKRAV